MAIKITTDGAVLSSFDPNDSTVCDLAFDGEHLWGASETGVLRAYTTEGNQVESLEGILSSGWGVTHEEGGYLWVSSPLTDSLYRIALSPEYICGDSNGDEEITPGDGYVILNYFGSGQAPVSCWAVNVNGDDGFTPSDGYTLLNYMGAGPALDCQPCEFLVYN
jgi:hypothetical protein